jgi:hypothetical protein
MKKFNVYTAVACFALAVIIFIFASGAKRIYSGGFFTILGAANVAMAVKKKD